VARKLRNKLQRRSPACGQASQDIAWHMALRGQLARAARKAAELLKHSALPQVAGSCTSTCFRRIAADSPAGPAPTMHTSYSIASRGSRAPAGTAAREAAALPCSSLLCGTGHVQRCRQRCRALRHMPKNAMA